MKIPAKNKKNITKIIKEGGVGVLPTDTLYGLVGLALNKKAVERIYEIKKRDKEKKLIILIAHKKDLKLFKINIDDRTKKALNKFWPNPISIVLPLSDDKTFNQSIFYLNRGTDTLAFRMPKPKWLRKLLKKTGPLVAPSANPEGMSPAENIEQAKAYFGNLVDFYVDKGQLKGQPSTLIALNEQGLEVRRQGVAEIKN